MGFQEIVGQYKVHILIVILVILLIWINFSVSVKWRENYVPMDNTPKIVLHYAPWCGHCQNFMPIWNKFEQYVNKNLKNKLIASKINCEANRDFCTKITGFPTIIFYKSDGKTETFLQGRTFDNLVTFVKSKI